MELDKLADALSKIGKYSVNASWTVSATDWLFSVCNARIWADKYGRNNFGDINRKVEEQNKLALQQRDMLRWAERSIKW